MGLFESVFGTHSSRELKKINPTVAKINALEPEFKALSDEELRGKTDIFKKRLADGETLDDILPEAFATVREASRRVLGMRHFDCQLVGGIVLHQGRIAEMKTGEGKTLVATLPAYLNALTGKGVHIVTVNDYLAQRDSEWMGKIHRFLGLDVGLIVHGLDNDQRRKAYAADITYGTNNEIGFDYLRDNMVIYKENMVQRGQAFAIVDEVDSILIDEARTPLIISGHGEESDEMYQKANAFVRGLRKYVVKEMESKENYDDVDGDYVVDEKNKNAVLTASGVEKAQKAFGIENLADIENVGLQHYINQALKAYGTMKRDIDYVVKDGEVIIVDEFTGRMMFGRRYSNGLHQAIEAKEGVKIENESKTLATITFQNLFRLYKKLSGMTGTALTEEDEFRQIYGLDVIEIPTNRPMIRKDLNDKVYKSEAGKFKAVVEKVKEVHAKGQPVLIGTVTIEKSELLSKLLKREGIEHNVLNAKYHEKEAEIVSQAGKHGAVTIATNMAGRGTDIKLDDAARAAGGLKIIGTERHESRRIDNQLRGRSGRQGDVGESKFYISLEDDIMRLFASEKLMSIFNALGVPENEEIHHKSLTKTIERAQKKIEGNNFGIRKNLMEYDKVNNDQREIIYAERARVLNGENMRDAIIKMMNEVIESQVDMFVGDDQETKDWDVAGLSQSLFEIIPVKLEIPKSEIEHLSKAEFKQLLKEAAVKLYEAKEAEFPEPEHIRELERIVLLRVIDRKWMDHLDDMEQLKQGIGLMAYGQRDPAVEYKIQGFEMFNDMIEGIKVETVKTLYHIQVEQKVEREEVAEVTGTNKDDTGVSKTKHRESEKIYPNDPCPCGSGKKYKNCCGRKA